MKVKNLRPVFLICSLLLFSAILFIGCGDRKDETSGNNTTDGNNEQTGSSELSAKGKEIFYAASTETGLKCADCHSDGTNDDKSLTKFFSPVNGVPKRTSTYHGMFKGEEVVKTAGGSTVCWERYLGYTDELTPEQISALNAYFEEIATPNDPKEIVYETIALPERDKEKLKVERDVILKLTGNPDNGQKLFKEACSFCHSKDTPVKEVPNLQEYEGNEKGIIYKARLGDEYMPFFRKDKLTDQDIADLGAFIMTKVVQQ